jgi:hypothetical protein
MLMIAAGTRAPIAIAAKSSEPFGKQDFEEKRHDIIVVRKLQARRMAHQTQRSPQPLLTIAACRGLEACT